MQTAYSYKRFSSSKQINPDKIEYQTNSARNFAEKHGYLLDEHLTFQDLGVSAFRGANREGHLGEFLLAVKHGLIKKDSVLLIESLDRLSRESARKALRTLEEICDEGITVITLIDGQEYTAERLDRDPSALFFSLVIFLRANEESLTRSKRLRSAWGRKIEMARRGEKVIITKSVPSWIKVRNGKFFVDKKKTKVVQYIFKLAAIGLGQSAITTKLNEEKIKSFRLKGPWHRATVAGLLRNEAVIGNYVPHFTHIEDGRKVNVAQPPIKNYYPRIVAQKTWNKTVEYRKKRRRTFDPKDKLFYKQVRNIFGRVARCPFCEGRFVKRVRSTATPFLPTQLEFLVCANGENKRGCKLRVVPYEPLENLFLSEGVKKISQQAEFLSEEDLLKGNPKHKHEKALLQARITDLLETVRSSPMDRVRLNMQLRNVFKKIIIDPRSKELILLWSYGGETRLSYEREAKEYLSSLISL